MRESYKNSKKRVGILVSSLGLVAVTAMAGVTGTAAWFTANRAAAVSAGTFTAYTPNTALKITAVAGHGTSRTIKEKGTTASDYTDNGIQTSTEVKSTDGKITGHTPSVLRDASYDNAHDKLYRANLSGNVDDTSAETNPTPTSYSVVTKYDTGAVVDNTVGKAAAKSKVFWALSWTYTFSYDSATYTSGSALFFDLGASSFTNSGTTNDIYQGFRIAFNATEGNHYTAASGDTGATTNKVTGAALSYFTWTNNVTKANDVNATVNGDASTYAENKYIGNTDGTSAGTVQTYADHRIVNTVSSGYTRFADENYSVAATSGTTALKDASGNPLVNGWLGNFTPGTSGVNQIVVRVVAWYEGTDDNVISSKANSVEALTANMTFYVRDLAA